MRLLLPNNWMQSIVPHIDQNNDFVLVGSISQMGAISKTEDWSKVILYNWDHYDFIDMAERPDWALFHSYCRKAREVWIPSHAHAFAFRRDIGIDPYVLNLACVIPSEFTGPVADGGYAMMSSRKDWYKRFPMFEQACQELGVAYRATHPEDTPREEYIRTLQNCRFYVQASIDESLGGLSLLEAVYNKKPVLMSNSINGGMEIYGDTIDYFRWDSMVDLKKKLKEFATGRITQPEAFDRIKNQTPEGVGAMINLRIKELQCQ